MSIPIDLLRNPVKFLAFGWPDVKIYDKQMEILRSIRDNDETFVPAGNMLGKDFISGYIAVWFFLSRNPCRIVTTSAKDDHLRVLWGEINRFVQTCRIPLSSLDGGPLVVNHHDLRKMINGRRCPISYVTGLVASADSIASMQGHHVANVGDGIARTLFISDESSSVPHEYYTMASTWARRMLVIGNPWPCENFFKQGVKGGDVKRDDDNGYYRKVIKIRAEDSPNVKLALKQVAAGKVPTGELLLHGVKDYAEYKKNRKLWDPIQQCVSLDGEFYEGAETNLYPPDWLKRAVDYARTSECRNYNGKCYLGVDTGEGGDKTAWCVINRARIVHLQSMKTPDTSVIPDITLDLMKQYKIHPKRVLFDRGGGGKEHVDYLRKRRFKVRSVGFSEAANDPFIYFRNRQAQKGNTTREEEAETKYAFRNRRAEMYGLVRYELLNPKLSRKFGISEEYSELIRQLRPLPLTYDDEGRMVLPPKSKDHQKTFKGDTIKKLLGCSPDESDAFVLSAFSMLGIPKPVVVGTV